MSPASSPALSAVRKHNPRHRPDGSLPLYFIPNQMDFLNTLIRFVFNATLKLPSHLRLGGLHPIILGRIAGNITVKAVVLAQFWY
jgi:hypothetical protein